MKLAEYARYDGLGLADLVRQGQVTSRELGRLALDAVEAVNPTLNCVIQTLPERLVDLRDESVPNGPFKGVPFLIKDLLLFERGVLSEAGSLLAEGLLADHDSELIVRFRSAGLVNLGRTTTPELGFSSATSSKLCGLTRNPWNPERISGGSSGGAAVAVASGVVPMAHGSDGGGSIRSPACFNGLVGLKPTRGRISEAPDAADPLSGLAVNFAITRTVRDCAAMLDAVSGPAPGDPHMAPPPPHPFLSALGVPPRNLRIAFTTKTFSGAPIDPHIVRAIEDTVALLERMGFAVQEAMPAIEWSAFTRANNVVWTAHLAHFCDVLGAMLDRSPSESNLQRTTWACYAFGKSLSSSDLLGALDVYNVVSRDIGRFFEDVDVFVTPTCTRLAPPHAAFDPDQAFDAEGWIEHLFALEMFCVLFNVTGQPAISLPLHQAPDGSQIGVQLVAKFGDDEGLLRLAAALEEALPWRERRPPIHVASI